MATNPFLQPIFFDSCAFDGGDQTEQSASVEARTLFEQHGGIINMLHSVQKEIDYPATPQWVKDLATSYIGTLQVPLNTQELKELRDIEVIIVGNGNLYKRRADCRHVFEAQKYGHHFVTTDNGILKHSAAIERRFITLFIIKPTEFLGIVKHRVETGTTSVF